MFKKIWDFLHTDTGELVAHCLIALALALGVEWLTGGYWQLVLDAAVVVGFVVRELSQHEWKFSAMGVQSWLEWVFPAIVVLIIYAV